MCSLNFLTKVCEFLMDNEGFMEEEAKEEIEEQEHIAVKLSYIIK